MVDNDETESRFLTIFGPDSELDHDAFHVEWRSSIPSRHSQLLNQLALQDKESWPVQVLKRLLECVRDECDALIYAIGVVDCWIEDASAFCVVYTSPLDTDLVGLRRVRGDQRPNPQEFGAPEPFPGFDVAAFLRTPDAPGLFAMQVADDIGDSLGVFRSHLRFDDDGLGWWGTLNASLPRRPDTRSKSE